MLSVWYGLSGDDADDVRFRRLRVGVTSLSGINLASLSATTNTRVPEYALLTSKDES